MTTVALFFVTLMTFCVSMALLLQILACGRPFRNYEERLAMLVACCYWIFTSARGVFNVVAGNMPTGAIGVGALMDWFGAFLLAFFMWAGLGRYEKLAAEIPKRSLFDDLAVIVSILMGGRKK